LIWEKKKMVEGEESRKPSIPDPGGVHPKATLSTTSTSIDVELAGHAKRKKFIREGGERNRLVGVRRLGKALGLRRLGHRPCKGIGCERVRMEKKGNVVELKKGEPMPQTEGEKKGKTTRQQIMEQTKETNPSMHGHVGGGSPTQSSRPTNQKKRERRKERNKGGDGSSYSCTRGRRRAQKTQKRKEAHSATQTQPAELEKG